MGNKAIMPKQSDIDRYLAVVRRANHLFSEPGSNIVVLNRGGVPSAYTNAERAAADIYLFGLHKKRIREKVKKLISLGLEPDYGVLESKYTRMMVRSDYIRLWCGETEQFENFAIEPAEIYDDMVRLNCIAENLEGNFTWILMDHVAQKLSKDEQDCFYEKCESLRKSVSAESFMGGRIGSTVGMCF